MLFKKIEIEELTLDGPGVVIKLKPESDETIVLEDKAPQESEGEALGMLLPVVISVAKLSIQNGGSGLKMI